MSDTGSMTVSNASNSWSNLVSRILPRKVVPAPATCSPEIYNLYRFFFCSLRHRAHFCRYADVTAQTTVKITPGSWCCVTCLALNLWKKNSPTNYVKRKKKLLDSVRVTAQTTVKITAGSWCCVTCLALNLWKKNSPTNYVKRKKKIAWQRTR